MEGPQCNPKFFMWVIPSHLFSRRRGPHIKNFRVGSEMGGVGSVSLALCAFFALDFKEGNLSGTSGNRRGLGLLTTKR